MTEIPPRPPAAPLADVAAAQDYDDDAPHRGDWPRASGRQVARLLAPLAAERDRLRAGPPPVPAPFPLGIALAALECIRQAHEAGTVAHDTAHRALDDAEAARRALRAALEPPVVPARPEVTAPVTALAAELERGAADLDALSRRPESLADKPHWNRIRGRVASLRYSANRVRELAPQWDALAAYAERQAADRERYLIALRNVARIVATAYEKLTPIEAVELIDSELEPLDLGEEA